MILGEIDLSIGATYLFAPFLFYKLNGRRDPARAVRDRSRWPCCMAVGFVNGFFMAIVGISSFVTTLGMLFTLEGLTLIISHGAPVATPGAKSRAPVSVTT